MTKMTKNQQNLHNVWLASTIDEKRLGLLYYDQQYSNLESFSKVSHKPVDRVIAAFVALSPNNAESSNYTALASCLAICAGLIPEDAPVIAFPNAKSKALTLLRDYRTPIEHVLRGIKTYSFYRNTLNANDPKFVTIDGHMHNAWRNVLTPLQDAGLSRTQYFAVQRDVRKLSNPLSLTPAKFQAIIWLTWKRTHQNFKFRTISIRVGLQPGPGVVDDRPIARIPNFLPERGWSIHSKGYLIFTSNAVTSGIRRGTRAHRLVVELLSGHKLDDSIEVHHMDNNKLNCCPCNLIAMIGLFNPSPARRDPYTGQYLTPEQWRKRYECDEVPF